MISRSCVNLIIWTGSAYRPFLHDRPFCAASSFQIGVSRGRRAASAEGLRGSCSDGIRPQANHTCESAWPLTPNRRRRLTPPPRIISGQLIPDFCYVAQRIIDKLKEGAAAGGPPLHGASVGIGAGAGAYPPTPAMKRFADSLARQKGISPPPEYKTSISICREFLSEHAPKKADVETAGRSSNRSRQVRHSCCTRKKLHRGKASSFPTRPRPTRLPWPCGLARTKESSAAKAVGRSPSGRRVQFHLNRRRRRRGLGNARLMPFPFHDPARPEFVTGTPLRSLWQHRGRVKVWRPLWLDGMVSPPGMISRHLRPGQAIRPAAFVGDPRGFFIAPSLHG